MEGKVPQMKIAIQEQQTLSTEKKAEIYDLLFNPDGSEKELRGSIEAKFGALRGSKTAVMETIGKLKAYFGNDFCEYGETKTHPYVSYVNMKKFRPDVENMIINYQKENKAAA